MIPSVISKLIILLFGTLYPAYASYKAVKTKNVKEYVKWMMYWIVFALFTSAETFTDIFFSFWFPFYYELKIILVVYLLSPATNGSSILYRKFVHPMLSKKEQEIDEYIAKAMEQGYHTMLNLGSRGIAYTTSIIMQTAIRGGGGLVNHIRKSYSLDDMNTHEARNRRITDGTDEPDEVEERPVIRQRRWNPRPMPMSSSSQVDLCFSDIDGSMTRKDRPRAMRSSEDFSSGYCSPDPMYMKYNGRDPLLRTASIGPTTRARTRIGQQEDDSGCSTTEPEESQYETDDGFPMSFPPLHPSLAHFVKPEYRYLFASLTQQQADTLVNNASCVESATAAVTPPSTVLRSIIAERKDIEDTGTKSVKHKKRQAPVPPEKSEDDYRTPEASPVPVRKVVVPDFEDKLETSDEETGGKTGEKSDKKENKEEEEEEEQRAEKEKKKLIKVGKESHLTKMLHLSKIYLPFWHPKSGKHSPPVQEPTGELPRNNSHGSLASQDSYISLKGEENVEKSEPERQLSVREMSQSPSSKRRSFISQ